MAETRNHEISESNQYTMQNIYETVVTSVTILFLSEFQFTLGEGQVIAGWDLGLRDMCVGELRELVVPSQYGYGEYPVGDKIPPRALLVFYVELLKISDPDEDGGKPNMFKEIDVDGDGLISHSEVKTNFLVGLNCKNHP